MSQFIDLTGHRYGKLLVIRCAGKNKVGHYIWECLCNCGATTIVSGGTMRSGKTLSCGCGQRNWLGDHTRTHGMSRSPTYRSFHKMHARCSSSNVRDYPSYGGRGIKVCERWSGKNGFINFLVDMGEKPKEKTLDRINNNENYDPENCKWSTFTEQSNNRRNTRFITWNGETQTITVWAARLGHSAGWLAKRLNKYPFEKAMEPFTQLAKMICPHCGESFLNIT